MAVNLSIFSTLYIPVYVHVLILLLLLLLYFKKVAREGRGGEIDQSFGP